MCGTLEKDLGEEGSLCCLTRSIRLSYVVVQGHGELNGLLTVKRLKEAKILQQQVPRSDAVSSREGTCVYRDRSNAPPRLRPQHMLDNGERKVCSDRLCHVLRACSLGSALTLSRRIQ